MTAPSFNYFYRVELQVASFTLGDIKPGSLAVRELITKTYNFVNKRVKDAATSAERETYIPILKSVGEVTLAAGEVLPTISFSSISLDDSRGSFGRDRRFSDVLERFTIIGQPINFYIGEAPLDSDAPPSWTLIGSGIGASWTKALSGDSAELTIQIQPSKISEKLINIEVSRDIPGMENAPDESIAKAVPLAFCGPPPYLFDTFTGHIYTGEQIKCTRISANGATTAKYAVATHLFRTTMAAPLDYAYVKKPWESESNNWIGIGVPLQVSVDYRSPISGTYSINSFASSAYRIPPWGSGASVKDTTGFVVGAVELSVKGQSTNPVRISNAYLSVFILRVDKVTLNVIDEVGRGRVSLATYDAQNNVTNSNFSIKISLDSPAILELHPDREHDFYVGFEGTDINAQDMVINRYTTGAPYQRLVKPAVPTATDSYNDWKVSQDIGGTIAYKLHPVEFTFNRHEDLNTPDGFTYSSLTLTQTAADLGQVNPSLDTLDVVVSAHGFCSYAYDGGTTAGTSSAYTATVSPAWTQYVHGQSVECQCHTPNSANATLSVNGLAALPIYENGAPILASRFTNSAFSPYPDAAFTVDTISSPNRFNITRYANYIYGLKIYEPQNVLNILSYEWSGESWEDKGRFDVTTLSASHYTPLFKINSTNHRARVLAGSIENKSTYSQALLEVSKGMASKIGIYKNGKLFIFPWGIVNATAYTIPQSDIIPLSWETRNDSSIINRAQVSFVRNYINTTANESNFKYSDDFSNSSNATVVAITERSRSIYGVKNIVDNNFPVYGFACGDWPLVVPDDTTTGLPGYLTAGTTRFFASDFLADYYISRFALPFVYCSFVVPYHRYKDIKMFDVISFHHSEFPAFYGTDPYAKPGVVNDGTTVTAVPTANNGEEFVRAQTYRGLVEAVSYVMAMEHAPAIRLTVQVLINTEFDPT